MPLRVLLRRIAGLGLRKAPPLRSAQPGAGMLGVHYYNAELEEIGERFNVWRLRGEHDRDLAFRISVEIASRLNDLESDLERVINFNKCR